MDEIKLPVHGIVIMTDKDGSSTIASDLHTDNMNEEDIEFNAAIDGIEALILAHYCAEINVNDSAYLEGIKTAVDACNNNF